MLAGTALALQVPDYTNASSVNTLLRLENVGTGGVAAFLGNANDATPLLVSNSGTFPAIQVAAIGHGMDMQFSNYGMTLTGEVSSGGSGIDVFQQCVDPLTDSCIAGKFRAFGNNNNIAISATGFTGINATGYNMVSSTGVQAAGGTGVRAMSSWPDGYGLYVYNNYGGGSSATGNAIFASSLKQTGIYSQSQAVNGVTGKSYSSGASGLYGENFSGGFGTVGRASGSGTGVMGDNSNASGFAGFFYGNVHVSGTLSKTYGTFRIDHPQDPANKYLSHSFVESPEMKNIYDGVVTLDGSGQATVVLPGYFEALNADFRYQLTPIGAPGMLYIKDEISHSRFTIAGGQPGMRVSWQVTGVRIDAAALAKPIIVEELKPASARGKYLNPEVFGLPRSASVGPQLSDNATRPHVDEVK